MNNKRIRVITPLRGIAIFTIFISHLSFWSESNLNKLFKYISFARFGVVFFFVLSGFVVAYGYSDKFQGEIQKNDYLRFIKGRIFKIYPIYIMSLVISAPLVINNLQKIGITGIAAIKNIVWKFILSLTLMQSIFPFKGIPHVINGVAWFLSTIFIIYLFVPFILKLNSRISKNIKTIVFLLIVNIIIYFCVYMTVWYIEYIKFANYNFYIGYAHPMVRVLNFTCGILLYDLYSLLIKKSEKFKYFTFYEVFISLVAIIWWILGSSFTDKYPVVLAEIINILISIILLFIFSFEKGGVSKILSNRVLFNFGNISFEFYLLHYPVINLGYLFLYKKFGNSELSQVIYSLIFFVISIFIAYIFNKYLAFRNLSSRPYDSFGRTEMYSKLDK